MNKLLLFLISTVLFVLNCFSQSPEKGVDENQGYELVWSDEFNYEGTPNPDYWKFEKGFERNNELQWYQEENAYCKDGILTIEARKEKRPNPLYSSDKKDWRSSRKSIEFTSSSIQTKGKKEFLYGRFEIKAKIPLGGGAWPAIWTLGTNMEWPSCGEIDIMEYYRIDNESHILANAAWGTDKRYDAKWKTKAIPFKYFPGKNKDWSKEFHVWRMDWDEQSIKLYLDDELLNEIPLSQTVNGSFGSYSNPFKQPHFLLLNLAIGGQQGGEPDLSAFPMKYEIDYVRVYQQKSPTIKSGEIWPDNNGNHINAHGGGVLYHNDKYYWFGEHKSENTSAALVGVNCYSSTNLTDWKYEGVAMPVSDDPESDITSGCIIERPKVIYNKQTGKFVMWFHLELKGQGYGAARAAVAVSDKVTGPYEFKSSARVNKGFYPFDMSDEVQKMELDKSMFDKWWTPDWYKAVENGLFIKRDLESGQMSRDMTLFVDDDGKAYHIYSSEENLTLHIAELTDDYTAHTGKYVRVAPAGHNEAPAIFKRNGIYWMITSGCTGWDPNAARMFSASSIWGPWKQYPNPCKGEKSEITFGGQSTFILPVYGKEDAYIFMGDIWRPKHPIDARYVWLPIRFENDIPTIEWMDEWGMNN
ncbi:MAG: family 43 glycosylhydrolase [Dysgonamonadaceae bacterium]